MPAFAATSIAGTRGMDHGEQLSRIARKYPARTAYICEGESRTFGEVDRRVTSLAHALMARGLRHGDRLALLMKNSIEMIEAMFAGWRVGAIVVPVNFRLVADEVGFILKDCGASVIVVDEGLSPLVGAVRDTLPDVRAVVVFGDAAAAGPGAEPLRDLFGEGDDAPVTVAVDEQDPALIMYTSGTTGRPRVRSSATSPAHEHPQRNGVAGHRGVRRRLVRQPPVVPHRRFDRNTAVCDRGRLRHHRASGNFDSRQAVEEMARLRVTGCVFVGMQWDEICDEVMASGARLSLRRASWGAANTPVEVLAKMARALPGVPVFSFFGQTEMSPVTCVLHAVDSERKRGSVGGRS